MVKIIQMKKIALILFLVICRLSVFAQVTSPAADTLKFHSNKADLGIFLKAVNAAGLTDIFTGDQSFTILAPDNQAFEKLPAGMLDTLLNPANKSALIALLNNHVIPGKLSAKQIAALIKANNGQTTLTTLTGSKLVVKINADRNLVLVDESGAESVIKRFDIPYGNTVIFVIGSVIVPKK